MTSSYAGVRAHESELSCCTYTVAIDFRFLHQHCSQRTDTEDGSYEICLASYRGRVPWYVEGPGKAFGKNANGAAEMCGGEDEVRV